MAKNDQQEAFEHALTASLSRVLDFLKFAEAKNAALLTFASAWVIAGVNALYGSAQLPPDWRNAFACALPLFTLAAAIAITSFLPKTLLTQFHQDPEQQKALLYFGDAASFSPAAYKERVRTRYYPPSDESATQNYLDDLSVQIAVNSKITRRKLRFFNVGALMVLVALGLLSVPAIKWLSLLVVTAACGAR